MRYNIKTFVTEILSFTLVALSFNATAAMDELVRLHKVYPEHIQFVSDQSIIWSDGTQMPVTDGLTNKTMQEKLDNPPLSLIKLKTLPTRLGSQPTLLNLILLTILVVSDMNHFFEKCMVIQKKKLKKN